MVKNFAARLSSTSRGLGEVGGFGMSAKSGKSDAGLADDWVEYAPNFAKPLLSAYPFLRNLNI